jgi:hypothetical protein
MRTRLIAGDIDRLARLGVRYDPKAPDQ